jgi:hypothetical protein
MRPLATFVLLGCLFSGSAAGQGTNGDVPKIVHFIVDGNRLVASNVRFNRFDELRLNARERIDRTSEGDAVIVVVTNQRVIAYGAVSGWRAIDRVPGERVETLSAEDFAGLVVTNRRMLNFNGESGVWGERTRTVTPSVPAR